MTLMLLAIQKLITLKQTIIAKTISRIISHKVKIAKTKKSSSNDNTNNSKDDKTSDKDSNKDSKSSDKENSKDKDASDKKDKNSKDDDSKSKDDKESSLKDTATAKAKEVVGSLADKAADAMELAAKKLKKRVKISSITINNINGF